MTKRNEINGNVHKYVGQVIKKNLHWIKRKADKNGAKSNSSKQASSFDVNVYRIFLLSLNVCIQQNQRNFLYTIERDEKNPPPPIVRVVQVTRKVVTNYEAI